MAFTAANGFASGADFHAAETGDAQVGARRLGPTYSASDSDCARGSLSPQRAERMGRRGLATGREEGRKTQVCSFGGHFVGQSGLSLMRISFCAPFCRPSNCQSISSTNRLAWQLVGCGKKALNFCPKFAPQKVALIRRKRQTETRCPRGPTGCGSVGSVCLLVQWARASPRGVLRKHIARWAANNYRHSGPLESLINDGRARDWLVRLV